MTKLRPAVLGAVALGLGLLVGGGVPPLDAQVPSEPSRPKKSVYGKLDGINKRLNGVFMLTDANQRVAWRFEAAVIAEIEKMPPANPMIVIYRQVTTNDKRVTAVAFPGTAASPTYMNLTGDRVALRSAPLVNGACGQADPATVQETTIPRGGLAEATDGCWCCAVAGESCNPGNKSGNGRALLVGCFE